MKSIWLARDKNGDLWGYSDKPIRGEEIFKISGEDMVFSVTDSLFPEITWENSPVEFTIKLEEEQQ